MASENGAEHTQLQQIDGMSVYDNKTPFLIMGVRQNQLNVVKNLIRTGADINVRCDIYGTTLLHEALRSNNVTSEMFQLLLNSGCNPNGKYDSCPPLCLAVEQNKIEVVKMLLNAGAHVNGTAICIPLIDAVQYGYIHIMELLLQCGANVNAQGVYGNTALHEAVLRKNLQLVKLLIQRGSKINNVRNKLDTPLTISIHSCQFDVAMLLINSGADLDLDVHRPLLHTAIKVNAPVELFECLLEHGARVTVEYIHYTALQFVISYSSYRNDKKLRIAKLLLIYGSNHYVEDDYGNTVLHWACQMGDVELVEYLIDYGLNVDAKNRQGKKPYDIAREKGHSNILKAIIKYHCNKYTIF